MSEPYLDFNYNSDVAIAALLYARVQSKLNYRYSKVKASALPSSEKRKSLRAKRKKRKK